MARRIVLLSDGTGNSPASVWRSNVWRTFDLLDLSDSGQIARYNDGIGTSSFKPLAWIQGAFGFGLKHNVLDLYKFLCRYYADEPEETEIFAFGFSRGAVTIRVLIGLINSQGLVTYSLNESELNAQAMLAYRAYRAERYHTVLQLERVFRKLRDIIVAFSGSQARYRKEDNRAVKSIRFVGLWDTVQAWAPFYEMSKGFSLWLWPLELPDRILPANVERACHALALDEERSTFHPVLWTEAGEPARQGERTRIEDERISQVWFPGVHSNVGGGYPDDALAEVPLYWMLAQARACGLVFHSRPDGIDPFALKTLRDGRLYDSRSGLASIYRYGPRHIYHLCHHRFSRRGGEAVDIDVPRIHESAIRRIQGANVYAPIGIPEKYAIVTRDGEVLEGSANPLETPEQARTRAYAQERIWDLVWWRRGLYFFTTVAWIHLILFPFIYPLDRSQEYSSPLSPFSQALRVIGAFLPSGANFWLDSFAANPGRFLMAFGLVAGGVGLAARLRWRISDSMLKIWHRPAERPGLPTGVVYRLRTDPNFKFVRWAIREQIAPFLCSIVLVYVGLALLSQLSFSLLDAAGLFCRGSGKPSPQVTDTPQAVAQFPIDQLCFATGVQLVQGERYTVTLTLDPSATEWRDGRLQVDSIAGFTIGELGAFDTRALMSAGVPWRRVLARPWFRPIVRIGETGADEYPMDPPVATPLRNAKELSVPLRARRTGEMFLYVNDAVIGVPGLAGVFYRNNRGQATVTVSRRP